MEKVSIVIVSMNKLSNLDICLPSIEKFTRVPHDVYVVAYMFDEENLKKLKEKYPYVNVIESNKIRGFAENNNLALRMVDSGYIYVQNDDTEYKEPVLDRLLESLKATPGASVMSPVLKRGDNSIQFCGRRKYSFLSFLKAQLGFRRNTSSMYENGEGIFKTYNVSGAGFLISRDLFKKMGWFDERYFFCPEDIAFSTLLNKKGYHCYVDANVTMVHYEGVSSKKSKLFYATTATAYLGESYFYGTNLFKRYIILSLWWCKMKAMSLYDINEHCKDYRYIYERVYSAYRKKQPTKELFIEEYNKIK